MLWPASHQAAVHPQEASPSFGPLSEAALKLAAVMSLADNGFQVAFPLPQA